MKVKFTLLPLLLLCFAIPVHSQTYTYYFNGNFNEAGSGPALAEVLSCGASSGSFTNQLINTASGNCGITPQPVFAFNEGGGVAFPNNSNIGGTYTIHIFWKFNSLSGYQRIIDFLDGSTDNGLYTLNNCLNFYPNGSVGTCPYFVPNTFYLLTLVRDASTNTITIYVNGTQFSTYVDASNNYAPATSTSPIVFFRDNIASNAQCEDRDGSVKYISLSPVAATATDVSTTFNSICSIALPVYFTSFTASKSGNNSLLNWQIETTSNTSAFIVQRSTNGSDFTDITTIAAQVSDRNYSFTDNHANAGKNYYRLKVTDRNGSFHYSSILKLDFKSNDALTLYPNPANNEVVISGLVRNKLIRLLNASGVLLKKLMTTGETMTLAIDNYPKGIYIVEYDNGLGTQRQKLLKY